MYKMLFVTKIMSFLLDEVLLKLQNGVIVFKASVLHMPSFFHQKCVYEIIIIAV